MTKVDIYARAAVTYGDATVNADWPRSR